jgi:predicted acylesterase/phospholipase RssA
MRFSFFEKIDFQSRNSILIRFCISFGFCCCFSLVSHKKIYTSMEAVSHKIGLACAGGGVEGAVYEIGALCALEDAITGLDFQNMHVYVGVSAGALITSNLANQISARQMSLAILSHKSMVNPISPEILFKPAVQEFFSKALEIPGFTTKKLYRFLKNFSDNTVLGALADFTELLPVGVFDNQPLANYLANNFTNNGISDDFRTLGKTLRVVATELDTGHTVRFGEPGFDHVPISKAVQASTALPGVYLPVEIDGKSYVDGVARRTVHASVALNEGSDLVFCINPIVPLDSETADEALRSQFGPMRKRGLPTVMSQTFRSMIHSRMKAGIKGYATSFPDADLLLFEPKADDYRMFYNNVFSYSTRREVCEHAYQMTLDNVRERSAEIKPVLQKYGLTLNRNTLNNPDQNLYTNQIKPVRGRLSSLDETLNKLDKLLGSDQQVA